MRQGGQASGTWDPTAPSALDQIRTAVEAERKAQVRSTLNPKIVLNLITYSSIEFNYNSIEFNYSSIEFDYSGIESNYNMIEFNYNSIEFDYIQ